VAETNRTVTEGDLDILNAATIAFALELMKQRTMLETEHRLRADFLRDLLSTTSEQDAVSIVAHAGYLGIDLLRSWDLLVVDLDEDDAEMTPRGPEGDSQRRRAFEAVRRTAAWRCPQAVTAVHGKSVVILTPADTARARDARTMAEYVLGDVQRIFPDSTLSVGIGETCHRIDDFPASFARARRALAASRSLGHRAGVVSLEDLGVYGLLFRSDDRGEMLEFARRTLRPLIQHDERHGTNLVQTLQVFLDENCSHRRTAERLFVHVNTLSARMIRIADVAQIDLHDATLRLNLHLALRILQLAGDVGRAPQASR
jgi:PucR family transcriptional regulator, purine catabolism regulatory protein